MFVHFVSLLKLWIFSLHSLSAWSGKIAFYMACFAVFMVLSSSCVEVKSAPIVFLNRCMHLGCIFLPFITPIRALIASTLSYLYICYIFTTSSSPLTDVILSRIVFTKAT